MVDIVRNHNNNEQQVEPGFGTEMHCIFPDQPAPCLPRTGAFQRSRLGDHYSGFLRECWTYFPHHLLSAIFCAACIILFGLYIFKDEKVRRAALIIGIIIIIAMTVFCFVQGHNYYETDLLLSAESESEGLVFDDSYHAEFADPSYGECTIDYENNLQTYKVHVRFEKQGETQMILTAPDGTQKKYDLIIGRSTYNIKEEGSDDWRY